MKNLEKVERYISLAVVSLYFIAGCYLLICPRCQMMQKEFRIIFAIFLLLYGSYRLARILLIKKSDDDENEEE
jgi:hypothetical protein